MVNRKNASHNPPRLAEKLLLWFLKDELAEEVLGDLEEKFYYTIDEHSPGRAKRNYWYQVFNYLRPFALKRTQSQRLNNSAMFRHNILISFRSFKRFKSTFLINLFGLASGLVCTLLIYFWVADELSIDNFHEKDDRLYQVMRNGVDNGEIKTITSMPGRLAEELMTNYPEVEAASMVWPPNFFGGEGYISHQNVQFKALAQFVDNEFLEMMSFPLVEGNSNTALHDKSDVLISETLAIKVFGSTRDLIGKTLHYNKGRATGDYLISGIFKDVPQNSTMQFDMLLNAEIMMEAYSYMEYWGNSNPDALVVLKQGTSPEAFNAKIKDLIQGKVQKSNSTLFIQKFSDRYLKGSYENGEIAGGRIMYVRLFSIVALIILSIACINFMNLSTAKAAGRLKEIGVKKALGARRRALINQYYTESFLLTTSSAVLAVGAVALMLPKFSYITGKTLSLNFSIELLMAIGLTVLVTSLLAGSYPALYLSRLKTTESLKGKLVKNLGDLWVRKGLVVLQFSVSIILIVSVLIISSQIHYIQSKNLGYERDNVIRFDNTGIDQTAYPGFLSSLETIAGVLSTSSAGHDLTGDHGKTSGVNWPGQEPDQRVDFINLEMSAGYIETMGMEIVLGRSFDRNRPNESSKIIFNETAIRQMGLKDPIGKTIKLWGNDKQIIGVVKDFHAESLYEPIQPTFIQAYPMLSSTLVKIQAGTELEVIQSLEGIYKEFSSGIPLDFKFLDSDYQAMYDSEKRVASLSQYFAVIAIIISCLGLFGLATFTAERRSKEIGIRKVLGSGNWRIVKLLSSDFNKMVVSALIIGLPISFLITRNWLQNFEFSIRLEPGYFLAASLITLTIAWLTVGLQTFKAARVNPVDSLRME